MPTEKDQKTVLLDKLTEQRQAIFDQLRHLAETMPESLELKKARADLVEFEKLEQQISDYDVTEKYKPTSITEACRRDSLLREQARRYGGVGGACPSCKNALSNSGRREPG